jgi:hypothetical protein
VGADEQVPRDDHPREVKRSIFAIEPILTLTRVKLHGDSSVTALASVDQVLHERGQLLL